MLHPSHFRRASHITQSRSCILPPGTISTEASERGDAVAADQGESKALELAVACVTAISLPISIIGLFTEKERTNVVFLITSIALTISALLLLLVYIRLRNTRKSLGSNATELQDAKAQLRSKKGELQSTETQLAAVRTDLSARETSLQATQDLLGTCLKPGCLIEIMTPIDRRWPNGLREQAISFATLGRNSRDEVSVYEFGGLATMLRAREARSIHVLFATTDAVSVYYGTINKDWVEDEPIGVGNRTRRRLLIIEEAGSHTDEYQSRVAPMFSHLEQSSTLRVLFDTDLRENPPMDHCLRDFGVFWDWDNKATGIFRFSQMGTIRSMSHALAGCYKVTDPGYLKTTQELFDEVWQNPLFNQERFELRRATLLEWTRRHPPSSPAGTVIARELVKVAGL